MRLRLCGLGLVAGAVLLSAAPLAAQVRDTSRTRRDTLRGRGDTAVVRRDTTKRDTTRDVRVAIPAREDSLALKAAARRDSAPVPRDTLKAPFIAAEPPVLADPNGSFVWDRRDVFSTGALTVQDLLDRVPGVTGLRVGWISQPMITSYLGDPGRVRVFLDGLELSDQDPRMNRIWDLTQIPLWALDDVRVERGASEIRIHMRSWRVERTTPFTRTDVYTGDQGTNLYRGLFGRRYKHGEVLQLAGQQYATAPGRNIESSDQLGALGRVGIARARWSADAFMLRHGRNRGRTFTEPVGDTVPSVESTRTDAYLRFGWGTPGRGAWAQTLALASKYAFGGQGSAATTTAGATDTVRFESQYLATGGYSRGPWRVSVSQRYRAAAQRRTWAPAMRLGFESKYLTANANGEGRFIDSTRRFDVSVVGRPLDYLFVAGAFGVERPFGDSVLVATSPRNSTFSRVEAGVRVGGLWLSGGLLRRDSVVLDAPTIYRSATPLLVDDARTATFAAVRGKVWKSLYADIQGIQWSDTGSYYRPRYQSRTELYISTPMLDRFPTGNFHFLLSAAHEYRSHILWPDTAGPIRVKGYRTFSTLLQFRIVSAEVFWNYRNVLGERYNHVPGYRLPRLSNIYGVRWEFWN